MAYIGKRPVDTFPAINAVTSALIAENNITAREIASGVISTSLLAANSITDTLIAANSIDASEIKTDAVRGLQIQDDAVTANHIATLTDHVLFNDNAQIKLGTSQDLKIYHDASNSYIEDTGTGNLNLKTNSAVSLLAGSEIMILATANGSVDLYHNNVKKFETTSAGATVTGVLTATVTGDVTGDLTGTASAVADAAVTSAKIATGAVLTSKIAENAITSSKIADGSIGPTQLAATAVSAGSYGSASSVPIITVDADGRLTAASTATVAGSLTVGADSGSNDVVTIGTDTLTIAGGGNITTTVSNNQVSIALDASPTVTGNLVVDGNLTVSGTTTTVNTTNISVADPLAVYSSGETGTPSKDSGIIVERGTASNVGWIWDESADQFAAVNTTEDGTTAGNVTIASYADIKGGNFYGNGANLTGVVSTLSALTDTSLTSVASGNMLIYDGTNSWDNVAMSGDATLAANGTITIASQAVETGMIAAGAINSGLLAANSVTAAKIPNGSILNEHLADDAVGADELAASAVVEASIVNASVTGAKIAANTITVANIADNAVDATKIASNSILTRHIDDNQITGDQIADDIVLSGTGSLRVPDGTTAQRPGSAALGMVRFNTDNNLFEGYSGSWGGIGGGESNFTTQTFTGDGSQAYVDLSQIPNSEDNLMVFIEGVYQNKTDYVLSGARITFDTAPANTRTIVVHHVKALVAGGNTNIDTYSSSTASPNNVNGSRVAFALSLAPITENNTQVFIDGVYQQKGSYATSGTTITFSEAPPSTSTVEVMIFTQTSINVPTDGSVTLAKIADQGTDGQVLTSTGSGVAWEDASGGGGSSVAFKTFGTNSLMVGDTTTGTIDAADNNTGLGVDVFASLTTGDNNTAIGYKAGTSLASSDSHNTFVGANAGENSTGYGCMAIGSEALKGWGGANYMTAIGYQALGTNNGTDTGTRNVVAIGNYAMQNLKDWSVVPSFGGDSVAVGDYAHQGTSDTYAYRNTTVGFKSLQSITTGNSNCMLGYHTGQSFTTGSQNVAMGAFALEDCETTTSLTAIGYNAMGNTTGGSGSAAYGAYALGAQTTGNTNTAIGSSSMSAATVSYANTAVGNTSLSALTTGRNTVSIGQNSGQVLTTGFNNIYVGMDTHASANNVDNEIVIGSKRDGYGTVDIVGKGSSTGFISPGTGAVYQGNNSASWATTSDRRIKKNIEDNNTGLEAIKQIQVRNFEYRTQDEITDFENPASAAVRKEGIQLGVIAQEIEQILPDVVNEESTGVKSVNPDNITWYLVNAIKEQQAQIEELKKKVGE